MRAWDLEVARPPLAGKQSRGQRMFDYLSELSGAPETRRSREDFHLEQERFDHFRFTREDQTGWMAEMANGTVGGPRTTQTVSSLSRGSRISRFAPARWR